MSLTGSNNMYKVDPLNRDNYAVWRRQLKWILNNLDLWNVTIRAETEPELADHKNVTAAEQQVIADWRRKDKKTRKEICLHIAFDIH
jgi:Domain of unknown function (DUF4219)